MDALYGLIGQVLDKMIPGSGPQIEPEKPKVFSTDPASCTVTMETCGILRRSPQWWQ